MRIRCCTPTYLRPRYGIPRVPYLDTLEAQLRVRVQEQNSVLEQTLINDDRMASSMKLCVHMAAMSQLSDPRQSITLVLNILNEAVAARPLTLICPGCSIWPRAAAGPHGPGGPA